MLYNLVPIVCAGFGRYSIAWPICAIVEPSMQRRIPSQELGKTLHNDGSAEL